MLRNLRPFTVFASRRSLLKIKQVSGTQNVLRLPVRNSSSISSADEDPNLPWYLRTAKKVATSIEMPKLPESSPQKLHDLVRYFIKDLGIEDIKVFDLSKNEEEEIDGSRFLGKYMVIGTGKSNKHLAKAGSEMMNFLKHEYGTPSSNIEGLVKDTLLIRQQKRLKRKGGKLSSPQSNDFGVTANSWIMIDTNIDDIYVHFLTEKRRKELNLEYLWCSAEDRPLYHQEVATTPSDDIFSGIRNYHTFSRASTTSGVPRPQHLPKFTRAYSTKPNINELVHLSESGSYQEISKFTNPNDPEVTQLILLSHINFFQNLPLNKAIAHADELYKSFEAAFPAFDASSDHWKIRYLFLDMMHKVDKSRWPFSIIENNFYGKASHGHRLTEEDLKYYIKSVIESPELSNRYLDPNSNYDQDSTPFKDEGSETFVNISNNKLGKIAKFIRLCYPDLPEGNVFDHFESWESTVLPLLLTVVSQTTHENFITPLKLSELSSPIANHKPVPYNKTHLDALLEVIRVSQPNFLLNDETRMNFIFILTILANGHEWEKVYKLWDAALENSDPTDSKSTFKPDTRPWAYLIDLVAKIGDPANARVFLQKRWPQMIHNGIDATDPRIGSATAVLLEVADPENVLFKNVK
ncbi:BA75_04208T0 [Komagataella pastoris]|uniref:ATPase synthesis protein 25 n=1 Tax=Komagataella pastoris TaxID=4922 RepID=A0A1B2JEH9_PICPA|nr:BA75_04208T0 [Komagataella pastoris]